MSCKSRASRALLVCGLAASITSCNRTAPRTVERIAIVAFENQTSDASNGWLGMAAAAVAAAQTTGNERLQTFVAGDVREAQTRLATRVIEGYLTSDGGRTALNATVRDEVSGKVLSAFTVTGADVLAIAGEIARQTGAPVASYTTSNAAAVRAFSEALAQSDAAAVEARLREALRLDPQYGAPYLALREVLSRTGRGAEGDALLSGASNLRLTVSERVRLKAASARTPEEQVDALIELARLQPGDTATLRQAGDAAMNLRLYDKALVAIGELLRITPNDEVPLNMRGYAHIYRGEFEAARAAFEEYRKRAPGSANAIDSMGEMMFYFRKYPESARLFLEAQQKEPGMIQGAQPFRAAYAHFLAGNMPEADRLFATWVSDPKDIRHAIWRRWTGRPPGDMPTALKALWALQDGDRAAAVSLAISARQQAPTPAAATLASIVFLLAQPSAPADVWMARIQQALPAPQQEANRRQLLGWALLLDQHGPEAVAQWRSVFERASGQFNNEQRILLATSLLLIGQEDEARKVMPHGFIPPMGLSAGLELLVYPMAVETSKKLHGAAK